MYRQCCLAGIYNKEIHNEENALFYSKKKAVSKKERIFKKPIPKLHPEIIRKDIILMNKVFKRVYGDDYKSNAGSRFMKAFPDIDHFNSYYGDEADTYESEKGLISSNMSHHCLISYDSMSS